MKKTIVVQVGIAGERQLFESLGEVIRYLNDMRVGKIEEWIDTRFGPHCTRVGFETANFHGTDYVTCHYANERGDYVEPIHHINLDEVYL